MKRLAKNIVVLGWVSFLTDVSSEMILPILPIFLVGTLGAGQVSVGLIEGVALATASLLKVVSGYVSDRMGRRKLLMVLGYVFSSSIKPIVALVTSWTQVLGIRFVDRVGKGIRTAPRDALIGDSSSEKRRGRSFGFHRSMDTAGAVVGSLIAFGILSLKTGAFRTIFALSAVPGLMAVLVLIFFVKEPIKRSRGEAPPVTLKRGELGKDFSRYLVLMMLLTLGQVGYAFALLRASGMGISDRMIPLIYMMYNVVYAILAMPAGILSDRWGRTRVLGAGIVFNGILAVGMAEVRAPVQIVVLFVLFGFVSAVYETVPKALATDLVPTAMRGTGLGLYHAVIGVTALPAFFLFGFLWEHIDVKAAFGFSACVSLGAFVWMASFRKPIRQV